MKFSLKISHKLWLNSLVFALPIALLLYFMVSGMNADIRFARLETWGARIFDPLSDLLVLAPRHQLLVTLERAGVPAAGKELRATADGIQNAFTELEQLSARFDRDLRIDPAGLRANNMLSIQPAALLNQWNTLHNSLNTLDANQLAQIHQDLSGNIRKLIARAGDTSNLILDPDLDSYYLVDLIVWMMPDMQVRLGDLLLFYQQLPPDTTLTDEQRTRFGVEAAMLKESFVLPIQQAITTSLREDQNFYGISPTLQADMPPVLENFSTSALEFAAILERLASSTSQQSVPFAEFRLAEERVISTGMALWKVGMQEVGGLLEKRISHYQRTRLLYVALSLVALLFACVLVFLISFGIRRGLKAVVTMTEQIALGELTEAPMEIRSKDEIGDLAQALNRMRERIREVLQEMAMVSQGIQQGNLNGRGQAETFVGSWRDLVSGMNNVIDAFVGPFTAIRHYLDRISTGDLPDQIAEEYHGDFNVIKQNVNRLIQTLQKMVGGISSGTDVLRDSVQHLTVSSQEIASTSNEQAAAVKEIVSTMEDSDRLTKSIESKVHDVTGLTEQTRTIVTDGLEVVRDSLNRMDEIKNANAETLAGIKELGDKIGSIWEIVNMINGIADQTKIIAFNAELEASTAGEAGKNFQIVASEIRRLADSTVASTDEIKAQITTIQQTSDRLTMTSEQDTEKIVAGWELSRTIQKLFENIRASAETSDRSMEQIALSVKQQVSAFEQILLTLKQISEGIDNFAVSTKATTGAAEQLRDMADQLRTVIDNFHT